MNKQVLYQGRAGLTLNGMTNTDTFLTNAINSHLRNNGWGVSQVGTVTPSGANFVYISMAVEMPCEQNIQSIENSLGQTILGTSTLIAGALFTDVQINAVSVLPNSCGSGTSTGNTSTGGISTYTVRAGDTFSRIASRYGLSIAQLQALNPQVTNINLIHVGQVLNVSGTPSTIPVITNVNPNTGATTVINTPVVSPNNPASTNNQSWFDRTFFTGAGALTGTAIGVLCVLGVVVITKNR